MIPYNYDDKLDSVATTCTRIGQVSCFSFSKGLLPVFSSINKTKKSVHNVLYFQSFSKLKPSMKEKSGGSGGASMGADET